MNDALVEIKLKLFDFVLLLIEIIPVRLDKNLRQGHPTLEFVSVSLVTKTFQQDRKKSQRQRGVLNLSFVNI
jgi:hypothetical protein